MLVISTIFGWLPYMAAGVGLVWYCIQIWESRTIQHWWRNRQMVKRAKKIAKLRAREKVILAELDALELKRAAQHAAVEKVEKARVAAAKEVLADSVRIAEESATNDSGPSTL